MSDERMGGYDGARFWVGQALGLARVHTRKAFPRKRPLGDSRPSPGAAGHRWPPGRRDDTACMT